jgi:hypothetical protein
MHKAVYKHDSFSWPVLDVSPTLLENKLKAIHAKYVGIRYKLGGKPDRTTGPRTRGIDCSGYVGQVLYELTNKELDLRFRGSVQQRDEIIDIGFKRSTVAACNEMDNTLRIVFLTPQATASGIGHVALVLNDRTYESYGSKGVGSREWSGETGWQEKCVVYVLTLPGEIFPLPL